MSDCIHATPLPHTLRVGVALLTHARTRFTWCSLHVLRPLGLMSLVTTSPGRRKFWGHEKLLLSTMKTYLILNHSDHNSELHDLHAIFCKIHRFLNSFIPLVYPSIFGCRQQPPPAAIRGRESDASRRVKISFPYKYEVLVAI